MELDADKLLMETIRDGIRDAGIVREKTTAA